MGERHEIQNKPHRFTLQRVYPALVFAPLFYAFVRYFPPEAFFGLILIVASLAFWEFMQVTLPSPVSPLALTTGIGSIGLLLAAIQWKDLTVATIVLTLLVLILLLIFMLNPERLKPFLTTPTATLLGIFYIGICLSYLLLIRKLESGNLLIFFVVLVTWAADTGGYYIGASMGKRPIAPPIKP